MNESYRIYKCEILATDYPDTPQSVKLLESGDKFFITCNRRYKIGDDYITDKFLISDICYYQHKWWQFWKKKKIIGYVVMVK